MSSLESAPASPSDAATVLAAVADFLARPWVDSACWTNEFWLRDVLSARLIVFFFLPLAVLLAVLPAQRLRAGMIVASLAGMAYLFGVPYAVFWLLMCVGLHALTQQLAIEFRRKDVWRGGPTLAAWGTIAGGMFAIMQLSAVRLPDATIQWILTHASWCYPYGFRGWGWEPDFGVFIDAPAGTPVQYFPLVFGQVHFFGAAYLAMRMLHYVSELARNTIPAEQRTLGRFLAYVCYFPLLIHGPLERYRPFHAQIDRSAAQRTPRDVAIGLGRILLGLAEGWLAAVYLWPTMVAHLAKDSAYYNDPGAIESYLFLWGGAFISVFGLFLQFSAYCEVSLGMSRLLGLRISENFDWPWFASSLTDLWRRWHVTLSAILRDYVFFPLVRRKWQPKVALVATFVLCGLWHALMVNFVLWGIVMGVLVGVNQSWARWMREIDQHAEWRLHAFRKAWLRLRPLPWLCAWLLTQHAFVYSTLYFFGNAWSPMVLWELVRRPIVALLATLGV